MWVAGGGGKTSCDDDEEVNECLHRQEEMGWMVELVKEILA